MEPIPCRSLAMDELDSHEAASHRHRERIRWSIVVSATFLVLSLGHTYYAFWRYPRHKAEEFEILNRNSEGREDRVAQTADVSVPVQADKVLTGIILTLVILGGAALLYFAYRNPVPAVAHSPGPVEESARPDYRTGVINVANPWVVKMFYIRCRDCGRTLKQWELRQRSTPVPRKRK
jgi:hypothetical protein